MSSEERFTLEEESPFKFASSPIYNIDYPRDLRKFIFRLQSRDSTFVSVSYL